jgi:hypothetical protein
MINNYEWYFEIKNIKNINDYLYKWKRYSVNIL